MGGSERARLPDLYAGDWEWQQKGPMIMTPCLSALSS